MDDQTLKAGHAKQGRPVMTKVLVIDDHQDTALMLGKLLGIVGYITKTAGNAAEALDLAEKESFDVMLSDISLPDVSGYELMKQMKRLHGIAGIAMSGYGMEEDISKSREAGFSDHLVKPVSLSQLDQAIRHAIAGQA